MTWSIAGIFPFIHRKSAAVPTALIPPVLSASTTSSPTGLPHNGMSIALFTAVVRNTFVLKDTVDTLDKVSTVGLRYSSSEHVFKFWEQATVIEFPVEQPFGPIKAFHDKLEEMSTTAYDLGYRGVVFVDDTKIAFGFEDNKIAMLMKLQFGGAN